MRENRRRSNRWFRDFWSLAKPFWVSEKWLVGVAMFVGIQASSLTIVYYNVLINKNGGTLINSIANRSRPDFYNALLELLALASMYIVFGLFGHFLRYRLGLIWREWMTRRFLERWLENQRHYFWNLSQKKDTDNPDQRIAEDIKIFIDSTDQIINFGIQNILTVFGYGFILWNLSGELAIPFGSWTLSIPGYLFWLCIGFAMLSNVSAYLVGKRLFGLKYTQQHREADFRFSLMKMRDNAEAIALSGGEGRELAASAISFSLVVENFRKVIRKTIHLEIFDFSHARVRKVFICLVASPRIFSGAMTVGAFSQCASAFEFLGDCAGIFQNMFRTFADWRSAAQRLCDFEESLSRAEMVHQNMPKMENAIQVIGVKDLTIRSPDNRVLIDSLCLEIKHGESVLLRGLSGVGKSTLFRIWAGIWPFFSGSVHPPVEQEALFLSQVPYLPQGTLREIILYPKATEAISPDQIIMHLKSFNLSNLVDKLDLKEDWQKVLSPGEQQRLVMIRAILARPKWLFLDEATSALDENHQALVYSALKNELPGSSLISIGHQRNLERLHDRVISLGLEDDGIRRKSS